MTMTTAVAQLSEQCSNYSSPISEAESDENDVNSVSTQPGDAFRNSPIDYLECNGTTNPQENHEPFESSSEAAVDKTLDSGILFPGKTQLLPEILYLDKFIKSCPQNLQKMILNDTKLIFECRQCSNLFRDLSNLALHKLFYCSKQPFTPMESTVISEIEKLESVIEGQSAFVVSNEYQDTDNAMFTFESSSHHKSPPKTQLNTNRMKPTQTVAPTEQSGNRTSDACVCQVCQQRFSSASNKSRHVKQKHPEVLLNNKNSAISMVQTLPKSNPIPYDSAAPKRNRCPVCATSFTGQWQLKVHLKYKHAHYKAIPVDPRIACGSHHRKEKDLQKPNGLENVVAKLKVGSDVDDENMSVEDESISSRDLPLEGNNSESPTEGSETSTLLVNDIYNAITCKCLVCNRGFYGCFSLIRHVKTQHLPSADFTSIRKALSQTLEVNPYRHNPNSTTAVKRKFDEMNSGASSDTNDSSLINGNHSNEVCIDRLPPARKDIINQYLHVIHKPSKTCLLCNRSMFDSSALRRHLIKIHGDPKQLSLLKKSTWFPNAPLKKNDSDLFPDDLKSEDLTTCIQCDNSFPSEDDLKLHIEKEHSVECAKCGKSSSRLYEGQLCLSCAMVHGDYDCQDCGQRFLEEWMLNSHQKSGDCSGRPISAEVEIVTETEEFLGDDKTEEDESKDSIYVCGICGKAIDNEEEYKEHLQLPHSLADDQ